MNYDGRRGCSNRNGEGIGRSTNVCPKYPGISIQNRKFRKPSYSDNQRVEGNIIGTANEQFCNNAGMHKVLAVVSVLGCTRREAIDALNLSAGAVGAAICSLRTFGSGAVVPAADIENFMDVIGGGLLEVLQRSSCYPAEPFLKPVEHSSPTREVTCRLKSREV